jgi:hypothetical protein
LESPESVMKALHQPTGVRALIMRMAAAVDSVVGASTVPARP